MRLFLRLAVFRCFNIICRPVFYHKHGNLVSTNLDFVGFCFLLTWYNVERIVDSFTSCRCLKNSLTTALAVIGCPWLETSW